MGNTMKAAVVRELGKPLALEEVPVPQPNENQVLVRIAATRDLPHDLHAVKGDWPVEATPPFIPGHEGGDGGRDRSCRLRRQGGRSGRNSVAAYGVRALLVLPDRVGDVVRLPVERPATP